MKNYLEFEKEIKALEQEVDGLKSPFGSEGISEVDTNKIKNTQSEINEKLKLPKEIKGKANPKSTTGRLDIFTRIITEHGSEYDFIDYNYKGKLYLEIIPQSFSIKIKKNISLNQIRFYKGPKGESTQREQKISVAKHAKRTRQYALV